METMIDLQRLIYIYNLWQSGNLHFNHEGVAILGFGVMAIGMFLFKLRPRHKYTMSWRVF